MSGEKVSHISFAVIADIHGNRWALEAVLQDIDRRGIQQIVNLGDHLTGPLDPAGTADFLIERGMLNICGNDDRVLFAPLEELSSSQRYTREQLTPAHLNWLRALPATAVIADEVFVCHGDLFDSAYLLEQVEASGVCLRSTRAIEASAAGIAQPVILCGHSHLPRTVSLPQGKLIVNPGSVGLPAYTMETPVPYAMESGSPHARYAILSRKLPSWQLTCLSLSTHLGPQKTLTSSGLKGDNKCCLPKRSGLWHKRTRNGCKTHQHSPDLLRQ